MFEIFLHATGSVSSSISIRPPVTTGRRALVVVAISNGKKSLGCTLQGTSRKSKRVSGFRARLKTKNGRKVLAARRAKGRHQISPKSVRKSGGKK
eukprot:jgi/Chrzof1/11874/Cz06g13050.t1